MADPVKQLRLNLSKSLFIRGLQCYKSLYLDRYHPELKDPITQSQERTFDTGADVGILARDLFPGGIEITYEKQTGGEQIKRTAEEINKGAAVLYEATFDFDGVFVRTDILHKGPKGWELYEVKATTEVKGVNLEDVAVQYYVLTGSGLEIAKACLVHLNNQYVRHGPIEVGKLFLMEDVTEAVRSKQGFIAEEAVRIRDMLKGATPAIDIGEYCDDPYPCDFHGHCWEHIPAESVFDLRQRGAKPFDLYRQGILLLKDIPPECLSVRQLMQLQAFLGRKEFIDRGAVRDFLNSLWFPLYFLDFETFMWAIPPFGGVRPYQQIPFQYSLHYLEKEGGELGHHEYLAEPNIDPRPALAEKLLEEIPEDACILAFNAGFESARLRELAAFLPRHSFKIGLLLNSVRDLAAPFRSQHVYDWRMKGSYSQKAVLPVLVPELSYSGMEVADGGMAMDAYQAMCQTRDPEEIARIRKALLKYCKLDTLGMVRILERLRRIA